MVPVLENYKDYEPPAYVRPAVERLLAHVPQRYLAGLQSVVLTSSTAVGAGKTMRAGGKRYQRDQCRGFYHPKRTSPPWIEILVDNVLDGLPSFGRHFAFVRELELGTVLYHEIGHHIDYTIERSGRGGERPAEEWSKRLISSFFRKHHWLALQASRPIVHVLRAIKQR